MYLLKLTYCMLKVLVVSERRVKGESAGRILEQGRRGSQRDMREDAGGALETARDWFDGTTTGVSCTHSQRYLLRTYNLYVFIMARRTSNIAERTRFLFLICFLSLISHFQEIVFWNRHFISCYDFIQDTFSTRTVQSSEEINCIYTIVIVSPEMS